MLGNFAGAVRIRDVFVVVCDGEGGCLGAMWSAAGDDFVFYDLAPLGMAGRG